MDRLVQNADDNSAAQAFNPPIADHEDGSEWTRVPTIHHSGIIEREFADVQTT